jgi:microcystin-dependent protein
MPGTPGLDDLPTVPPLHRLVDREGERFEFATADGSFVADLEDVAVRADGERERFSARFRATEAVGPRQGRYRLESRAADAFDAFLAPVTDATPDAAPGTEPLFEAVVDRDRSLAPGEPDDAGRGGLLSGLFGDTGERGPLGRLLAGPGDGRSRRSVLGGLLGLGAGGALGGGRGQRSTGTLASEPFTGQILTIGFDWAPSGFAFCDGSTLSISQNEALFSLIGTTYGGDGRTTFALPDLRGRVTVGAGDGPGLTRRRLGRQGGAEAVGLSTNQLPAHDHGVSVSVSQDLSVPASSSEGDTDVPGGNALAAVPGPRGESGLPIYASGSTDAAMPLSGEATATADQAPVGAGDTHQNMMPYTTVSKVISLYGLYPTRS